MAASTASSHIRIKTRLPSLSLTSLTVGGSSSSTSCLKNRTRTYYSLSSILLKNKNNTNLKTCPTFSQVKYQLQSYRMFAIVPTAKGKLVEEKMLSGMEGWDFEEFHVDPESRFDEEEKTANINGTVEPGPPPIPDRELCETDVYSLDRAQFVWFVGRVASQGIDNYNLWMKIEDVVVRMQKLTCSETTRLLQAYAYGPRNIEEIDISKGFEHLLKSVPSNVEKYTHEQIIRVLYALCKRQTVFPKELDFLLSEILERITKLRGHQLLRVASCLEHTEGVDQDMLKLLAKQILPYVTTLNPTQFATYVQLCVKLKIHQKEEVVDKLNTVLKKKLRRWHNGQWILDAGMPLFLHDLMKASTVTTWLQMLHDQRVPLPLTSHSNNVADTDLNSDSVKDEKNKVNSATRLWNLQRLLIMDLTLKLDRNFVLNARAQRILEKARHLGDHGGLEPSEKDITTLYEKPFVFQDLIHYFELLGVLCHPILIGPYYIELADPLSRRIIEWNMNWLRYPIYERDSMQEYCTRKHRFLEHPLQPLGQWTVLKLDVEQFYQLSDEGDERLEFVRSFVEEHHLPRTDGGAVPIG